MSLSKILFSILRFLIPNEYPSFKPQMILAQLQTAKVVSVDSKNFGEENENVPGFTICFDTGWEIDYSFKKHSNGIVSEVLECKAFKHTPTLFGFQDGKVMYTQTSPEWKWSPPDTMYEQHANLALVQLREIIKIAHS